MNRSMYCYRSQQTNQKTVLATLLEGVSNKKFVIKVKILVFNSFNVFKVYNVEEKVIRWWPDTGYTLENVSFHDKWVHISENQCFCKSYCQSVKNI